MAHTNAIYSPPGVGAILLEQPGGDFRIDHDQKFNATTNVQYASEKRRGAWAALSWRYDSGLVAGSVGSLEDALALTGDHQAAIGFFCASQTATRDLPLTSASCTTSNVGATRLNIPVEGTAAPSLRPTGAGGHDQRLTERVRVPCRARARFERHACAIRSRQSAGPFADGWEPLLLISMSPPRVAAQAGTNGNSIATIAEPRTERRVHPVSRPVPVCPILHTCSTKVRVTRHVPVRTLRRSSRTLTAPFDRRPRSARGRR
jgi:hypothetical protein